MIYKFQNRDRANFDADYLELSSEANTLALCLTDDDVENPISSRSLSIQLNESDIEDLILTLTNIQREIFEYKKS